MTGLRQQDVPGRVLIVEGNVTGHRLSYVRILLDAAVGAGFEVTLALPPEADATPEFATHLSSSESQYSRCGMAEFDLASIADVARQLNATRTVVPDGDALAVALASARRWDAPGTLSVLVMREFAQHRRFVVATKLRSLGKRVVFRRVRRIDHVDAFVLRGAAAARTSGVDYVVDPVDVNVDPAAVDELRVRWKVEQDEFVFAVLGAIDERKNVDMVMRAVLAGVEAGAFTKRPCVLVAGRFAAGMVERLKPLAAALANHRVRVLCIDAALPANEFDAAVSLADCLVLAYSNDGPSGLLGKAAALGTRVIAAGSPTLRRECAAIGPGAAWAPLSAVSLSRALAGAEAMPAPADRDYAAPTDFAHRLLGIAPRS